MGIGENIRRLRESRGLSQDELAKIAGVTNKAISSWELNNHVPRMGAIQKMADFFGTQKSAIIEDDLDIFSIPGIMPMPKMKKVPRLGTIACGEPILAEENIEAYDLVSIETRCDFSLKCKGDSMSGARILDGDIVFVRQQPTVENGEIAAVLIDSEATLKRFYRYGDTVLLRAENPNFKDLEYKNGDLDGIRIIGKAMAFKSHVR